MVLGGALPLSAESRWSPVEKWPPVPESVKWDKPSSIALEPDGSLLIFQRGAPAILRYRQGHELHSSFSSGFFQMAHGMKVAPDGNIWVTDARRSVIVKFSPRGEQLKMLGTPDTPGATADCFNGVADLAFLPNGDFYVADGYRNARVIKFDREGRFLFEWGRPGKGPGEFHLPHSIAIDKNGRVYVGDRENQRIQIFSPEGNYITEWRHGYPYGIAFDHESHLWMGDGIHNRVVRIDPDGRAVDSFELPVDKKDGTGAHMVAVDKSGAVYVAETGRYMVRKYVKR